MDTIRTVDITELSNKELKKIFKTIAIEGYITKYPWNTVNDDSILIGKIKNYSCQIEFTSNVYGNKSSYICICSYDVESRRFMCKYYELINGIDCIYGELNEEGLGYIFVNKTK